MDIIYNSLSSLLHSICNIKASRMPTNRELREARQEVLSGKDIYAFSFEYIAKDFLKEFLGYEIFKGLSFNEIKHKYIEYFGGCFSETPNIENEFYKYICLKYLDLDKEPRDLLLALYRDASKDLLKITKNIEKCVNQIEKINQKNKDKKIESEEGYEKGFFEHYRDLNASAKDEIIKFLISEEIYNLALKRSFINTYIPLDLLTGYTYLNNAARYDPDNFSEISNKFLDLDLSESRKIKQLYKEDQDKFYQRTFQYIEDHNILEKVRERVESNHILNARKDIIMPALNAYVPNKQLFLNLIPLQIEGLFYEYCLAVDVSEENLQKASIGQKLDKIQGLNSDFYDFEYFKFVFPVTRNRIAHGKLIAPEDIEKTAAFMLLDLADVTERIVTDNLPINRILLALKRTQKELPCFDEDLIKIAFFMASENKLPPFYNQNTLLQSMKSQFTEDRFFEIVKRISKIEDYVLICGLKKIISWLLKEDPALESKCISAFQEIGKTEKILKQNKRTSKGQGDATLFNFFGKVDQAFEIIPES
jgi:hypothetical protein